MHSFWMCWGISILTESDRLFFFSSVKIQSESRWHVLFLYSQPTSTFSILLSSLRTLWKLEQTTQCRCVSQQHQCQDRFFILQWWKCRCWNGLKSLNPLWKRMMMCERCSRGVRLTSRAEWWPHAREESQCENSIKCCLTVITNRSDTHVEILMVVCPGTSAQIWL